MSASIWLGKFPLKQPPDYKGRVLGRLLPDAQTLLGMSAPELAKVAQFRDDILYLIKQDPLRFFRPSNGGQEAFLREWDTDRSAIVLLFLAGNKAGKTTAGAVALAERCLGRALWDRTNRSLSWPVPARCVCLAEDFDSHNETIVPNILSWFPRDTVKRIQRNSAGHVTEIQLTNGSIIHFKTYAQGSDTAEGKDWDFVWCDEPPPRSFYTAVFRGLVSTGGKMIITATLLKEVWLYDEQDQDHVRVFMSTIHDNPWLSQDAKEAFLNSLPLEERETRELGKPASMTGLIYRSFCDREPYVIPYPEKLPENVPYIIGIDPHERKPVYALWGYISPFDEIVWLNWAHVRGNVEQIMTGLRNKEREMNLPSQPRLCVMDPNRGTSTQINQITWQSVFEDEGYEVLLGDDDLNIGHTMMYNFLTVSERTGQPGMVFTDACRGIYGPIYQMLRYSWDDWGSRIRDKRSPKEKPKDAYKNSPDICRYTAMASLSYDSLMRGYKVLDRKLGNWRPYGRVVQMGA